MTPRPTRPRAPLDRRPRATGHSQPGTARRHGTAQLGARKEKGSEAGNRETPSAPPGCGTPRRRPQRPATRGPKKRRKGGGGERGNTTCPPHSGEHRRRPRRRHLRRAPAGEPNNTAPRNTGAVVVVGGPNGTEETAAVARVKPRPGDPRRVGRRGMRGRRLGTPSSDSGGLCTAPL